MLGVNGVGKRRHLARRLLARHPPLAERHGIDRIGLAARDPLDSRARPVIGESVSSEARALIGQIRWRERIGSIDQLQRPPAQVTTERASRPTCRANAEDHFERFGQRSDVGQRNCRIEIVGPSDVATGSTAARITCNSRSSTSLRLPGQLARTPTLIAREREKLRAQLPTEAELAGQFGVNRSTVQERTRQLGPRGW